MHYDETLRQIRDHLDALRQEQTKQHRALIKMLAWLIGVVILGIGSFLFMPLMRE